MTLLEVVIVVSIIAAIAGTIAIKILKQKDQADRRITTINARTIRGAVKLWKIDNPGCPSFQDLRNDELLDEDVSGTDLWGNGWNIECDGQRISVGTAGPDKTGGTEDDIRVPPV